MWHTFLIWELINTPLPDSHPFRRLPILKTRIDLPKGYSINIYELSRGFIILMVIFTLVERLFGIMIFSFLWICLGFVAIIILGFIFLAVSGGYLAVKISRVLGEFHTLGLHDLVSITPYGSQGAIWSIARLAYYHTNSFRKSNILIRNGLIAITVISTLVQVSDWVFLLLGIYFCSSQGIIMGYLIGIWSMTVSRDDLNRSMTALGGFLGSQMILYLLTLLMIGGLSALYTIMGWNPFITLPLIQFLGFVLLCEIQVRLMLRLLVRQSELPYWSWRLEAGILQK